MTKKQTEMTTHCVRVKFSFEDTILDRLFDLEEQLQKALEDAGTGELDGNEVGEGKAELFMYGPDADPLLDTILPVLQSSELIHDGVIIKRYGPIEDGILEESIDLSEYKPMVSA